MTVHKVINLMVRIETSLKEAFLPILFGGEEVETDMRKIPGHSIEHVGLGILDPGSQ